MRWHNASAQWRPDSAGYSLFNPLRGVQKKRAHKRDRRREKDEGEKERGEERREGGCRLAYMQLLTCCKQVLSYICNAPYKSYITYGPQGARNNFPVSV